MKFRIMTNGEKFAIQGEHDGLFKKTWIDLRENKWGDIHWSDPSFCGNLFTHSKIFNKYKEAEKYIHEKFGTTSEIIREWRPA